MVREFVGEAKHRLAALLQENVEHVEQQRALVARRVSARHQSRQDEIAACDTEQIVARRQARHQRHEQPSTAPVQSIEEARQPSARHRRTEVGRGGVLEMMALVDHETIVGRQDRRLSPVLRHTTHGHVRQQQMVVHDDDVRLRRLASRLEEEALLVQRAAGALAQVRLGRNFVPQLGTRRDRQIAERSVARARGPRLNRVELLLQAVVEQRVAGGARLLQAKQTEIVVPAFEQCEAHSLVAQRAYEERQILADELLLQVDRVRRHDRALTVRRRPPQRRHEITERLADAGSGLEESDSAVVVQPRNFRRHRALSRPILIARVHGGYASVRPEIAIDRRRVELHEVGA